MRYFLLLALAACKGDGNSLDDDTDAIGDTDATGDTDTDSDTEAPDPCEFAIPATAEVVDDTQSRTEDGLVLWVCRNNTLSYSGSGATIYLEQRADLVTNGTGNTVYAVTGADIHNFGEGNTFTVGDANDVVDESDNGATIEQCDGLKYETSAAPSPGC